MALCSVLFTIVSRDEDNAGGVNGAGFANGAARGVTPLRCVPSR